MLGDNDRINCLSKYQDINQVDCDGNNAVMRICKGDYTTDNDNLVTVVETLINLGLCLDAINYNGDTPLTLLGSLRSYCPDMNKTTEDIGRLLLKRGVPPHVVNNEGQTALLKASLSGLDNLVLDLINENADVDHTTPRDGRSILQHLCHMNNGKTATLLLDHGARIDYQDYQGRTALAIAIDKGHEALAYILMTKYSADPDLTDNGGLTSLHLAIIKNQSRIVDVLLQSDANRLVRCHNGATPLMVAVAEGNMRLVDCLINNNVANEKERQRILNQIDYDGVTPLIQAVRMKHVGIVKLLADDTSFLSHCDYVHGMNALMWAIHGCEHGDLRDVEIINILYTAYLTSSAINQTSQCALGQTALHFAVGKMIWIMEMFLRYKDHINLDVPDNHGCTPLMKALLNSDSDSARHQSRMLINAGAKLDVLTHHLDGYGSLSPLHYVVGSSPFLTRYLLDNGASVDFQNADGDTALMHAIRHGFNFDGAGEETIKILMGRLPDVSITNNKGETAFSIATDLQRVLDPLVWHAITPRHD